MSAIKQHANIWDIFHKIYTLIALFGTPIVALTKHFWGFPTFEYFDLSLCAFLLLSVGIVFLMISSKRKTGSIKPLILRKWFLYTYGLITLVAFGNLLLLIGEKYSPRMEVPQSKTRILIMLPLGDVIKSAYQDGMRQMYGYAEFLTDYDSRYTDIYDFVPVDHSMNYIYAKGIIEKEINNGTKYFICSTSKVNEELSENFEKIVSHCKFSGPKPILICTVTSSPKITLKPNMIYRFYIRSQEEGKSLAELGNSRNLNSATYIVVNDPYGKGALGEFKKNWKGQLTEGIKVDFGAGVDDICNQIERHLKNIPENNRQAIFIAHYGNGIDNILKALSREKIKGVILATSSLSINDWQLPIKTILENYNWFTCVPSYNSIDNNQEDVVKNFITHTLKRLVQTINTTSNNPGSTFDENWKNVQVYTNLDITWDTNGDAIIPIKAVDKTYFK